MGDKKIAVHRNFTLAVPCNFVPSKERKKEATFYYHRPIHQSPGPLSCCVSLIPISHRQYRRHTISLSLKVLFLHCLFKASFHINIAAVRYVFALWYPRHASVPCCACTVPQIVSDLLPFQHHEIAAYLSRQVSISLGLCTGTH